MKPRQSTSYRFDNFTLDVSNRELLRDGEPVSLPAKAFDMLVALIENGGRLLGKDELFERVWPDQVVEESNLTVQVSAIRKALGDRTQNPKYLVTVPGHGYRFIAAVEREEEEEVTIEHHSIARIESAALLQPGEVQALMNEGSAEQRTRWRKALVIVVALLFSGLGIYLFNRPTKQPKMSINSIAVLPFKPLAAANRDESLELGMAESLITRLGGLKSVVVRQMSAVRKYTDLGQDAIAAGKEQKVDAVLDGSIQKADERLRVTVRLVSVADGRQLWADQFDEKAADIFAVQTSISRQVVEEIAKLTGNETEKLKSSNTENIEAYNCYSRGRFFWNKRTGEGLQQAIHYFEQAIAADPKYARAYLGLAETYVVLPDHGGMSPEVTVPKARACAQKAIELDSNLYEAYATLAAIAADQWQWSEAEKQFKQALVLNPNYSTAHQWYGEYLVHVGRPDAALLEFQRALELDPTSLIINLLLGHTLYLAHRNDEALAQLQETLKLDQEFAMTEWSLGMVYRQKGMHEQAIAAFHKALQFSNGGSKFLALLGAEYANVGNLRDAQNALDKLVGMQKQKQATSEDMAIIYIGLGDKERAFEWLEKAYLDHAASMQFLRVEPFFDPLRSDPRFADLLRRVGPS